MCIVYFYDSTNMFETYMPRFAFGVILTLEWHYDHNFRFKANEKIGVCNICH